MQYIFWSGGFDSTYLLCKMAHEEVEIQPIYYHWEDPREEIEIARHAVILSLIRAHEECKANILDPIYVERDDLPEVDGFAAAWEKHKADSFRSRTTGLSWMYERLGRLAARYSGIACGIEAPAPGTRDMSRTKKYLLECGLTIAEDGSLSGDSDVMTIVGNIRFPLLDTDAAQEWAAFQEWGWEDVAKATRSCANANTPDRECGACMFCETKWKYGDTFLWRFDEDAQKLHAIKTYLAAKNADLALYFEKYVCGLRFIIPLAERYGDDEGIKKAEEITAYFDKLEEKYPNLEEVDAPED